MACGVDPGVTIGCRRNYDSLERSRWRPQDMDAAEAYSSRARTKNLHLCAVRDSFVRRVARREAERQSQTVRCRAGSVVRYHVTVGSAVVWIQPYCYWRLLVWVIQDCSIVTTAGTVQYNERKRWIL